MTCVNPIDVGVRVIYLLFIWRFVLRVRPLFVRLPLLAPQFVHLVAGQRGRTLHDFAAAVDLDRRPARVFLVAILNAADRDPAQLLLSGC